MANRRKGQLAATPEWRKHLRPVLRRLFWRLHRQAEQVEIRRIEREEQS